MRSEGHQIPFETTTGNRPIERHHTARYYAHHVKETLTTRVSKLICTIILFVLFVVGLIAFILWLSLRPHRPRFHIRDFTLPSSGQQYGGLNANIIFSVIDRNPNHKVGIYYDDVVQVSVTYKDQSIGDATLLFPFFQAPKNTTIITGSLVGPTLKVTAQQWQQIIADRSRGLVNFSLGVSSSIRFKILAWTITKRHRMHANCAVGVGPDGLILPRYRDRRCSVYFT